MRGRELADALVPAPLVHSACCRTARPRVTGGRLVLVDGVLTTGATVDGCARALLRVGAANVDVLVFARVAEPV